jgi:CRP-like cAMP-binding protein
VAKADVLICKLESIATLTDEQRAALGELEGEVRQFKRGEDVAREGDRPAVCVTVLSGMLCRYKIRPTGQRQIMAFHTPGDMPDLHSLFIEVMDHSLGAVTRTEVLTISHERMLDFLDRYRDLANVLWRDTLIDAAVFREWTVNVGSRDARIRIAHMLCEVLTRMRAVGLAEGNSCELPLTQEDIGDATGLTNVHVSRTISVLRADGLLELDRGALRVLDWESLTKVGEFDPAYLHLRSNASGERRIGR